MASLELEDYARQIDSVIAAAQALVDNHSLADLTRPAPAGGWSAVECIDHIAVTLEKYLPVLRAALEAGKHSKGEGPFQYGLLARMFLWVLEPPVRMRVKAPSVFAPRPQPEPQAVLRNYIARHNELQSLLLLARGLDIAAIRLASPATPKLKLPAGAVFGILTAHARRHLWQARRALNES
ncbi:MAG: DinB family protein [Bryobacterales bacterium]|nr:DinB family protein [Bryobacterales bacterium]